jgi:hypothetical protein
VTTELPEKKTALLGTQEHRGYRIIPGIAVSISKRKITVSYKTNDIAFIK